MAVKLPIGTAYLKRRFKLYQRGARRKALSFSLSFEQFKEIVIQNCIYCGAVPRLAASVDSRPIPMNGIDRVEPNVGYVWENCVPCCKRCNSMKSRDTLEEFFDRVFKIYTKNKLGL